MILTPLYYSYPRTYCQILIGDIPRVYSEYLSSIYFLLTSERPKTLQNSFNDNIDMTCSPRGHFPKMFGHPPILIERHTVYLQSFIIIDSLI